MSNSVYKVKWKVNPFSTLFSVETESGIHICHVHVLARANYIVKLHNESLEKPDEGPR